MRTGNLGASLLPPLASDTRRAATPDGTPTTLPIPVMAEAGTGIKAYASQSRYSAASRRTATPFAFTTTLIASSTRSLA